MAQNVTLKNIVNILKILNEAELLYIYQQPVCDEQGDLHLVTFPNHSSIAYSDSNDMFGNIIQYKDMLSCDAYHAIFIDGAIIRVTYFFDRYKNLIRHNLWYWPNPFAIPEEDIKNIPLLDALDLYASSWEEYVKFRTPLRFDYDPKSASKNHSASHLHMQTEECRISVQEPMCFANFIKFIFKNFYFSKWESNNFWDKLPLDFEHIGNSLNADQMESAHLRWNKSLNES